MGSKFRMMISRIAALFSRRAESDIDTELSFHVDELTEENARAGMDRAEARRRAVLTLGGIAQTTEACRDALSPRLLRDLVRDLEYGIRQLWRCRGFSAVAVLSLALGIGASTTIFSMVDAVLLRSLPYHDADRIVNLREIDAAGRKITFAEPNYVEVRSRNHSLDAVAEYVYGLTTVLGGDEPVRTQVAAVSVDFFQTLGVQPEVGRVFDNVEARPGGNPVVLVSHGFWQKELGGRSDLAATPLRIYGLEFTVIGIMPARFNFPKDAELWLPIEQFPSSPSRTSHGKRCIGHLRAGSTLEQAQAELSALARQLKAENGKDIDLVDISVMPLQEALIGETRTPFLLVLGAVTFLLLVACTNVVNLMLSRSTARQQEFAIRSALGANLPRLARQLLAENLVLTACAGALGLVCAYWGVNALVGLNQANLPRADEVGVNARVAGFTSALSVLVACVLSLAPLFRFRQQRVQDSLKETSRRHPSGGAGGHLRQILVAAEIAMTLMLLIGAALLIRSFVNVLQIDPGFRPGGTVSMEISVPWAEEREELPRMVSFYRQVIERTAALPGVVAAGGVNGLPMAGGGADGQFLIDNNSTLKGYGEYRVASPDYFRTMGIRLLRGRVFDETDGPDRPHVAVISQALARQYFPNQDPIGKGIQYGNMDGDARLFHIIGLVSDVREYGLEAAPRPTVYAYYVQRPVQARTFTIVARTQGDVNALIPALRSTLRSLDRNVPANVRTLDQVFSASLAARRFSLVIFGVFAAVALPLAAMGIYGVTSYAVAQRIPEIGVRIALGAQVGDILKMIVGYGARSILLGTMIGMTGALALTHLMNSLLFGLSPTDPWTFAAVAVIMLLVGLIACYIPAHRATKVDPIIALRYE